MIDALRTALSSRADAMIHRIGQLVEINSFTENREGGARVAAELAADLAGVGLGVEVVSSDTHAPHVVASNRAARESAEGAVVIVGHLDTVFPPGTFERFVVDEKAGLLRGPGVLDMKGGLVVAIEALRALAKCELLEKVPIRFAIVSDEEIGSPEGKKVLEEKLAGAKAALVLEAGRAKDAIITARKGTAGVKVTATGKAAHAGNAHAAGANAIWALARFVDRAQALTDYDRGVTVNVGVIKGGDSKNTVPDAAEAALDYRFLKVADGEAALRALEAAAKEAAASVPGTSLEVRWTAGRLPLERTDANLALARAYGAFAKEAGLGDGDAPILGGGSDASTTAAMGIPSIDGLGPRGSGFHTKDELVEVATLLPKALALAAFVASCG